MASPTVAAESRAAVPAIASISTGTGVPAGATGPTRSTWSTRTSGAARVAPRSTSTAALAAEVARGGGELPADAGPRHLSAARPVVVCGRVLREAHLEATEAARLVAAITSGASGAPAAAAISAVSAPTTVAAATVVAPPALRRRHAIDGIVKLAARDRTVGPLLALEYAHEAHLVEPIANNIERFYQPRSPVGLNP